ncbi:MAG: hypothetical protein AMXMBFR64_07200 [Myxococcales bacterium]
MSLGDAVVEQLLRRCERERPLGGDLVLLRDHAAIAGASPVLERPEGPWRLVRVGGELSLRAALLDGGRLVAAVAPGAPPLALDLTDRAWLGRVLDVQAQDVVSAAAGRPCARLQDEALARAVLDDPAWVGRAAGAWTLGGDTVTEDELRSVLVAAEVGWDRRLERAAPAELLARWIVEGTPALRNRALVDAELRRAHGAEGAWLARALGDLEGVVLAGAVGRCARVAAIAGVEPDPVVAALVEQAARRAWRAPDRVRAALRAAEAAAHAARVGAADAGALPLVAAALDVALLELATEAAGGRSVGEDRLEPLRRSLHATERADALELVTALGRLARFGEEPPAEAVDELLREAAASTAWADLEVRRARRLADAVGGALAAPARQVVERAVAARDTVNRRFAEALAAGESAVQGRGDLRRPLPLHALSKALLRPLLDKGQRVFLVVLDGCDVSTLLELLLAGGPAGLALPAVDGLLGDDLRALGPLLVAAAPVPTVTAHARRALFAGETPGNTALDDAEAEAANAKADRAAFERNRALEGIPKRLLLKGDLGADGSAAVEALDDARLRLVVGVWNGVDDALASHQTAPLGPWSWGAVGGGLVDALAAAARAGFAIVVTADHGHTPYLDNARKVAPGARGQRFGDEPLDGAVRFEAGPRRDRALWALWRTGAWAGTQRRGFHGGASLEEVAVPVALLGPVAPGQGRPTPPAWWADEGARAEPRRDLLRAPAAPMRAAAPPVVATTWGAAQVPAEVREALASAPDMLTLVEQLAERRDLSTGQLATLLGKKALLVQGQLARLRHVLHQAGVAAPFEVEEGDELMIRWRRR